MPVAFPRAGADAIVTAVAAAITPRMRIAVLDHIMSAGALVLPITRMVAACHAAGVPVLVLSAETAAMVAASLGTETGAGNGLAGSIGLVRVPARCPPTEENAPGAQT